jgi:hypothetical protein
MNTRNADPARRDARILRESRIDSHETTMDSNNSIFEASNDPDVDAHVVAAALRLPARFDPTLKPINLDGSRPSPKMEAGKCDVISISQGSLSSECRPTSLEMVMKSLKSA